MAARTALLINCSRDEARQIREAAQQQRRTFSGYVLHIVLRTVDLEERLFARLERVQDRSQLEKARPRTTMLIRCSSSEASRIRKAAHRRDTSISGYVLRALHRSWRVSREIPDTLPSSGTR